MDRPEKILYYYLHKYNDCKNYSCNSSLVRNSVQETRGIKMRNFHRCIRHSVLFISTNFKIIINKFYN